MQRSKTWHETASQTAGPYVQIGCLPNFCEISDVFEADLGASALCDKALGLRITVHGTVFDGHGAPVKDAMIEIWQADASGRYGPSDPRGAGDANFSGFGRCPCDTDSGEWCVETVKPGPVPFPDGGWMAPHVLVWIAARGINIGLQTRMYFPEDRDAIAADPLLQRIADQPLIETMIATRETGSVYRFNIHLQGLQETVFFDV